MAWVVLGESLTGSSHKAKQIKCQDYLLYKLVNSLNHWLVVVASDGAGSALHSDVGASLTCSEVINIIEKNNPETYNAKEAFVQLFDEVRNSLIVKADKLNAKVRELACTVIVGLIGPSDAYFAQIGDGAIVILDNDGYKVVFWPEPTEYANCTNFLTDDNYISNILYENYNYQINHIALFTDGLQRLALDYNNRMPYPGFFTPLFNTLEKSNNDSHITESFRVFLDSEKINQRTDDDKTLFLAIRKQ